jgi:hypothetical protein
MNDVEPGVGIQTSGVIVNKSFGAIRVDGLERHTSK